MAKTKRRVNRTVPGGTTLLKEGPQVSSDLVRDPRIASQDRGVLWVLPGLDERTSKSIFEHVFRGYTSVCWAFEPCELDVDVLTESGSVESRRLCYKPGQAIAATLVENEAELLDELALRGVARDQVSFGEGPSRSTLHQR